MDLKKLGIQTNNAGACFGFQEWSKTTNAGLLESINPATESLLGKVHAASAEDYEQVVAAAQKGFAIWRNVPAPKRGEVVRRLGDALREIKNDLGSLVAMEMGKSKQEGDGEVQEMIDIADFACGQSRMLYGLSMHSERPQHRMYEQWHPLGPIGVITAFNFPVAVWAWNAFLAAICGDTVIWKPSPKTPLCAIAVQHLCNRVMQEMGYDGVFNLFIPDNSQLIEAMVDDPRLPLISFTGSTAVGRGVAERVAKRLGKSLLELGGNNAIIVDDTADLKLAIPAIVFGAVGTAGQRCTTTRRLIIHEKIYDKLLPALINAYKQITIGDPLNEKNLMGPLASRAAVDQFLQAIDTVRKLGGEILYGGKAISGKGFFVEPTIVAAHNDYSIVQHETFAPILYVMKYHSLEQAISLQNSVKQGLSSAFFTKDLQSAEIYLAASGSDCGIANINIGTSGAEIGGAFGGEKDTGGGRESGSDSWKQYMRRQTNTINWSDQLPLAQGIKFTLS
jgi:aldehyde dehydrogenase (NAD+)